MPSPLPVCWCGDPGTYALDALHPAGVGTTEQRWVWTQAGEPDHLIVTRCRAHAGVFAAEVTDGHLTPVELHPIDGTRWGGA